jgi:uncharacterized delta-60 repeat protein
MKSKAIAFSNLWIIRVCACVVAATLVATIAINRVEAASGDLDLSFGTGGFVTTDLGAQEEAEAVAIQPDGRIVIGVKRSPLSGSDFILMRYNATGTVDTSFGVGGVVQTNFLGFGGIITSVKVDSRGRILAAGYIYTSSQGASGDFALARYLSSGALDTSFGSQGKVIRDNGAGALAQAIAIQKDGKIVVAGGSNGDFTVFRLTSNGAPDLTFAFGNVVATDFNDTWDHAHAIVLQSDGRIVVGGDAKSMNGPGQGFTSSDFALARYNTNGTLDTTFGEGGKVTNRFSGDFNYCRDLLIRSTPFGGEQIIAVGTISYFTSDYSTGDFGIACYLSDGSLNPLFGAGGVISTDFGYRDFATSAVQQADGKIIVAGWGANHFFALARYNSNGSLDRSFGNGGKIITHMGSGSEILGLALTPQAEIIVAGYVHYIYGPGPTDGNADIAIAKYFP